MSSTSETMAAYKAALCVYNQMTCKLNDARDECFAAYLKLGLMLAPYEVKEVKEVKEAPDASTAPKAKPLELKAGDPISVCLAVANAQKQAYNLAFKEHTKAYYAMSAAFRATLE